MAVKRYKGKKSLKQPDEFITFSSRLLRQVILHKTKIVSALGGIAALVLILSAVSYFSQRAEDQSLLMLTHAMSRYESVQSESGPVEAYHAAKDDLMKISETYGKKSGGRLSNFFLANCSFAAGEFEQAAALYRQAVADFKGIVPFETLAKSSLGYSLEQQGDHEAAASIFADMPTASDPMPADEFLFSLGRQYAAMGNIDLERETAKKLIETYPQSMYTNVVREVFSTLADPSAS